MQLHSLSKKLNINTDIYLVDIWRNLKIFKYKQYCIFGRISVDYKGHNPMKQQDLVKYYMGNI